MVKNNKMIFRNGLQIILVFLLISCSHLKPSFIQTKDYAYLKAKSIPPLRMPPDVQSQEFKNYYPVVDHSSSDSKKKVKLTPPGLVV